MVCILGMVKNRLQQAFSLIEILFVLAIFSIMLLMLVPNKRVLVGKNRALSYVNELRSALQFTRISAIKFGEPVIFCGSKDHKSCDDRWDEGRIVITRSNKVLRVFPKVFAGDKLIWQGSILAKDQITFLPNGATKEQRGHFYYCFGNSPGDGLAVILEATGRVRISDKTPDNKTISCNF